MNSEYASKVFTRAVNSLANFQGIGKKTAVRLVLDLLKKDKELLLHFAQCFEDLAYQIRYCVECHNISDEDHCLICTNPNRDSHLLCVVEDLRDVVAIENTFQFKGKYHILGGLLSPLKGVHPSHLHIDTLIERIQKQAQTEQPIREVIVALRANIEGDTTNFYLYQQLKKFDIILSSIARGIGINDEIQYADEVTLGKSIAHRVALETMIRY